MYDRQERIFKVVVTGSARLDIFQKGGDSLLGRYEYLRLHPFSVGELTHGKTRPPPDDWKLLKIPAKDLSAIWQRLEQNSGFPEPYTKNDKRYYNRWSARRRDLLIREDLRELTDIKSLSLVEHLAVLLPDRVSSTLSINSLREEIDVAHGTASSWLDALDRLYYSFRLSPFSKKISRALKKEQKLYLWDWAQVADEGARFENMVAGHLLKSVHAWTDLGYGEFALHYIRDKEKNEVDFLVTKDRKPAVLIEAKLTDEKPTKALPHFSEQLGNIPMIQLVKTPGVDLRRGMYRVASAAQYLAALN